MRYISVFGLLAVLPSLAAAQAPPATPPAQPVQAVPVALDLVQLGLEPTELGELGLALGVRQAFGLVRWGVDDGLRRRRPGQPAAERALETVERRNEAWDDDPDWDDNSDEEE